MGISDTFKKMIGIEEIEEEATEEEINEAKENLKRQSNSRPAFERNPEPVKENKVSSIERKISVAGTSAFKLVVIEPKSFDECPKLVDSLKGRRPVIINLETVETEVAKKIFDFLSGATYALNGNVQKVASNIFIFAPESVDIAANEQERGFDFGGSRSPWNR